jgi:hypothetical protein
VNATRGAVAVGAIGGVTWQPQSNSAAIKPTLRNRNVSVRTMEWIYLEAAIALVVLIVIVWWTVAARHKPDRDDKPAARK